jgi:hypothetical protein
VVEGVLKVEAQQGENRVDVSLFDDDGVMVAEWVQMDGDADATDRPELFRSHDGEVATAALGDVITVVRLRDGQIAARGRADPAMEAAFPLDGRCTLEVAGELMLDGGHSGHYGGGTGFFWSGLEPRPGPAEVEAEFARLRAELAAASNVSIRRRLALRTDTQVVVIHESERSRADGGEALLWPPIVGPTGVLLRHAVVTDDGRSHSVESQRPWLVQPDGTVVQLPFELGVSPLLATSDGRWLLPGADALWRDDYDEPLSLLDAGGRVEPLLVGGRPVPASRVLREAVPHVLSALQPIDPEGDVPWATTSARWDRAANELLLAINIDKDDDTRTVVVAGVPLDGSAPGRPIAHIEPRPGCQVAVAP